jgi:prepilin-type N-terminal cleavage/methylation domain-containing protein
MSKKPNGFTLIELLVVIAIIGVLSAVVLASMNSARAKTRYTRILEDFRSIETAVRLAYDADKTYPADVLWGVFPPELTQYLNRWPKPPCSGWTYDYENWSDGRIYVTARNAANDDVVYYCIEDESESCPNTASAPSSGSINIVTDWPAKAIMCTEQ